jgi:hypothetical protein
MNRGTSFVQPEGLVEPLDIDLESLDHALMDLLTSDWQTLDDSEAPDTVLETPLLSPAA